MKKNMSGFMLYKEKVECYDAVSTISFKINNGDSDMMSHVIMSVFKISLAEANIPWSPPSNASPCQHNAISVIFTFLCLFLQ